MTLEEQAQSRLDVLIAKGTLVQTSFSRPSPYDGGSPVVDPGKFAEWRSQTLTFLRGFLPSDHTYVDSFDKQAAKATLGQVQAGLGILQGMREDVVGEHLTELRVLVSAEVFSELMDMARHLLENGYVSPAASLCGAVLEDGLRRIATRAGVRVRESDDLNTLNQSCMGKGVYSAIDRSRIQVWIVVRNKADHGKWDEVSERDVDDMLTGVSRFIDDHLKSAEKV